jgi:hypothetical protein
MRNLPTKDAEALSTARTLLTEVLMDLVPDVHTEMFAKIDEARRLVREAMS